MVALQTGMGVRVSFEVHIAYPDTFFSKNSIKGPKRLIRFVLEDKDSPDGSVVHSSQSNTDFVIK
jgi:hypothetical protein